MFDSKTIFVRASALLLVLAGAAHAGSTITVNTTASTIDFAATGNGATTLVRPSWDMTPQSWNSNQPSPSSGVWVPGSGAPTVTQLVADLATRGDLKISLPEAIVIANATQYAGSEAGPTTIVFDTAAMGGNTIVSQSGADNWWYGPNMLPPIYSDIVIDGGSGVAIQRFNPSSSTVTPFRLFYVAGKFHNLVDGKNAGAGLPTNTPGKLTLRNITLSNGLAMGGGSYFGGGGAGLGGAIYNQGTLILDHTTLSDNRALGGASHKNGTGAGGGGLGGDSLHYGGGGMRYNAEGTTDPLPSSGGGFLSFEPLLEGGAAFAGTTPGTAGTSFFGGGGYAGGQPISTSSCTTFGNGGGFIGSASSTQRGDGGGYSYHCSGGGGAFGGGGGGYESSAVNVAGAGGVGGGGGQGADGGFGGGGGASAYGGFGGGSGYWNTTAWGFGSGGGAPGGNAYAAGGGGAGFGGAVFNHTGSVTIENGSQIVNNIAEGGSGYGGGAGYGGGVFNLDGTVLIDGSSIASNTVTGGAAATANGGQTGLAAGGAVYNRFQSEDVGVFDLRAYRGAPFSPSLTAVTLRNATLSGSIGGVDCFTDGGKRQESGTDEAYVGSLHFQGVNTIGADAAGINACGNFNHRGVRFTFSLIDDGAGDFAAQGWLAANSPFQQNLQAAAALWAREFDVDGVDLHVVVVADNSVPRFSGTFYNGWSLGPAGSNTLFEPSPLSKMRTGASPVLPYDIIFNVNTAFVNANYWIDPTPNDRNDLTVPSGRTDLVSIVLHELEHGLGMAGWRSMTNDATFGTFPDGFVNPFDTLTSYDTTNGPFFTGANAKNAFGGNPVPLTYWPASNANVGSDFYHFATCSNRFDTALDKRLRYALMSDCPVPTDGTYNAITPLDRAVLRDIGEPLKIFHDDFELQNTDALTHP